VHLPLFGCLQASRNYIAKHFKPASFFQLEARCFCPEEGAELIHRAVVILFILFILFYLL
jgi:hypothetical protein